MDFDQTCLYQSFGGDVMNNLILVTIKVPPEWIEGFEPNLEIAKT